MRHALDKEHWKNLLPAVNAWLESVGVTATTTATQGHFVIAARINETSKAVEVDAPDLEASWRSKLSDALNQLGWAGKSGPTSLVVDGKACTVALIDKAEGDPQRRDRKFGLDMGRALKDVKASELNIVQASDGSALNIFEGLVQGLYELDSFKGTKNKVLENFPKKVNLVTAQRLDDEKIKQAKWLGYSLNFMRFLQDAPANYLNPLKFAEIGQAIGTEYGFKTAILNREDMEKQGMGSLLSVADGSDVEARLIVLEIQGQDTSKTVALVGKGVTFDTGGISLKPGAGMEEMKYDMSGAAAVLGTAMFLGKVKPPTNVVAIIGAVENMPSGKATRPGDVVRAMNGKTIEVLNTDAEGRLVLADALAYAVKHYNPALVIDIATLTGAVLFGLGTVGAALMSNDQDTADYVRKASDAFGEPLWQLPLWPELKKEVKGDVADLRNIAKANVKAGTIIGAVFLAEFVGESKWVHLDVAGTAWNTLAHGYPQSGGSGFGLRALAAACLNFNK